MSSPAHSFRVCFFLIGVRSPNHGNEGTCVSFFRTTYRNWPKKQQQTTLIKQQRHRYRPICGRQEELGIGPNPDSEARNYGLHLAIISVSTFSLLNSWIHLIFFPPTLRASCSLRYKFKNAHTMHQLTFMSKLYAKTNRLPIVIFQNPRLLPGRGITHVRVSPAKPVHAWRTTSVQRNRDIRQLRLATSLWKIYLRKNRFSSGFPVRY